MKNKSELVWMIDILVQFVLMIVSYCINNTNLLIVTSALMLFATINLESDMIQEDIRNAGN